jgi:hypothetical protein
LRRIHDADKEAERKEIERGIATCSETEAVVNRNQLCVAASMQTSIITVMKVPITTSRKIIMGMGSWGSRL